MKKLVLFLGVLLVSTVIHAQTNDLTPIGTASKPLATVTSYLAANTNALSATNWSAFAAYSHVSGGASKNGGTAGAVYYWSQYVGTQIRLQYLDTGLNNSKWMLPNGEITLQSSYRPFGESFPLTLRPLLEMGAATDLSGNLYAVVGAGSELDLYTSKTTAVIQRVSVFYGKEKWEGQGHDFNVAQYGGAINLNIGNIVKWFRNK